MLTPPTPAYTPAAPVPLEACAPVEAALAWLTTLEGTLGLPAGALPGAATAAEGGHDPGAGLCLRHREVKTYFTGVTVVFEWREQGLPRHDEDLVVWLRVRGNEVHGMGVRDGRSAEATAPLVDPELIAARMADPAGTLAAAGVALAPGGEVLGATGGVARSTLPSGENLGRAVCIDLHLLEPVSGYRRVRVRAQDLVLYADHAIAAGVADLKVWNWDPATTGAGLTKTATASTLDALTGLVTGVPTTGDLANARVAVKGAPGPSTPPDTWAYGVATAEGAAVHAFWHVDHALSQLDDLGFGVAAYLPNQAGPLEVSVSAGATTTPWGAGYNSAKAVEFGPTVGLSEAVDRRIAYHEVFGHVVLYNHIADHRPLYTNFFTHSFGDAFAVIYADAEWPVHTDFQTFPFSFPAPSPSDFDTNPGARRHDRAPSLGNAWGWGDGKWINGATKHGDYGQEQKASSTLFRLYRALGGDANSAARKLAARTTAWLTLQAIAKLTPGTRPDHAQAFADTMQVADLDDWTTQGWTGGAYNKVIRWAFEKQGAYQSPLSMATPYEVEGHPPTVDVYFPDARDGAYPYTSSWSHDTAIWNRNAADGLLTTQAPVAGVPNYLYVRLRNRGSTTSPAGTVTTYVRKAAFGTQWPTDFHPVGVKSHPALVPGAADVVVGPFAWVPKASTFYAYLGVVDNPSDRANTQHFGATQPVGVERLVPHDNNVILRQTWMFKFVPPVKFPAASLLLPALPPAELLNPRAQPVEVVVVPSLGYGGVHHRGLTALHGGPVKRFVLAPGQTVSLAAPAPGATVGWRASARSLMLRYSVYYDGIPQGSVAWIGTP